MRNYDPTDKKALIHLFSVRDNRRENERECKQRREKEKRGKTKRGGEERMKGEEMGR